MLRYLHCIKMSKLHFDFIALCAHSGKKYIFLKVPLTPDICLSLPSVARSAIGSFSTAVVFRQLHHDIPTNPLIKNQS